MKVSKALLAIAALAIGMTAGSASAFEFHGYFRSGIGVSKGGGMVCFKNPGNFDYKFRLGNECETYGEFQFDEMVFKGKDGVEFKYTGMLGMATTQVGDFENLASPQNHIALRQNWVGAKLPQLGGATIWLGKRYYHRNDIHMIDFFYWNPSNPGGGIEDVDLGIGKFAFALFANGNQPKSNTITSDIRVYGIPVNPGGTIELGVDLGFVVDQPCTGGQTAGCLPAGSNRSRVSPLFVVQHFQNGFLGGFNKVAFEWGTGSQANADGSGNFGGGTSDDRQWRVVEHLTFQPVPEVSGSIVFTYQDIKNAAGGGRKGWGAGIRPVFHVSEYFKVQGEFGYDSFTAKGVNGAADADASNLFKATIAPTLVAGGTYWSRPELRLFVTYATWNDAAQAASLASEVANRGSGIANGAFGSAKSGATVGAQVEAWW
jgi:maltoporin